MASQYDKISVIDPIAPALERVKTILFRPFDLGRWFVIGFCAWLAYLGTGGHPNLNLSWREHRRGIQLEHILRQAKYFVTENLFWIVPVAIFAVMLAIVLWLVLIWLSSRGRFMFLHCVAANKAEVKNTWSKFGKHANGLFLFRILLGLIGAASILPFIIAIVFFAVILSHRGAHIVPAMGILMFVLIMITIALIFFLIKKFTTDFVVPIMFLRTTSCVAAWREFLTILSANKARFVLYVLFQIVIGICISTIILATACLTCCCACCILAIPYIGTVLLLPVFVFKRAYSLYYLRQFGPQFDVFSSEI